MTTKEKELLDYVYAQADNLVDFMRRNGYSSEKMVGYTVTIGYEYEGHVFDRVESSFCNTDDEGKPVRSVSRSYNHYTDKSDYDETIFQKGKKE